MHISRVEHFWPLLPLEASLLLCSLVHLYLAFHCSFHILGNAGPSMQQDFYTVEGLASQFLNSAFINLNNIPDYRLRPMLRILWLWLKPGQQLLQNVAEVSLSKLASQPPLLLSKAEQEEGVGKVDQIKWSLPLPPLHGSLGCPPLFRGM